MTKKPKSSDNKLEQAYSKLLERLKDAIEATEEKTAFILHHQIEKAKKLAVQLDELSQEEAEKVAEYVKRDLYEAGEFLNETGHVLGNWLAFDWQLIEENLWENFLTVADTAKLELNQLMQELEKNAIYKKGEVIGPSTLECTNCRQQLHFHQAKQIPACPSCQGQDYKRVVNT